MCPLLGTWPATQACALDWELNQWPFDLQASTQSTEPHQPGWKVTFSMLVWIKTSPCTLSKKIWLFSNKKLEIYWNYQIWNAKLIYIYFFNNILTLLRCLSWLEHLPTHQKVAGLILGQGTDVGCGFNPRSGPVQEATDQCFSLTTMFLSVFLSLPYSLSKISEYISLGGNKKIKSISLDEDLKN